MRTLGSVLALSGAALAALLALPSPARACGGCFHPPPTATEQVLVTGHRMAVSLSATETTLWDQFQYAGNPADFAWILPIQGTATVELADNAFFEALAQATQIQLVGTYPPLVTRCDDPCPDRFAGSSDRSAEFGGGRVDGGGSGVTVYHEGAVGPYETATIGSEDPNALLDWLRDSGYMIPDTVLPVISHYVAGGLNFTALKLNPNAGVNQMQPVRVTTPGHMPIFPLRMVSVGSSDPVGLLIYVFAEGRHRARNFPTVELDRTELVYDWDTSRFNYDQVFDDTLAAHDRRAWVVELAGAPPSATLRSYVSFDDAGGEHRSAEDYAVVTRGLALPYLTVLRAEMPLRHLDEDLILEPDDGAPVGARIEVPRDVNRPWEPDCPTDCRDPSGLATPGAAGGPGAVVGARRPDGLCSAGPLGAAGGAALLLGLAGLAGLLRTRLRRARR